jgi:hypothetical protein
MPNASGSHDLAKPRQIEVLVVRSNPADTLLTVEAFAAGLTTGLYVARKGKYAHAPLPDLIFLDLTAGRSR